MWVAGWFILWLRDCKLCNNQYTIAIDWVPYCIVLYCFRILISQPLDRSIGSSLQELFQFLFYYHYVKIINQKKFGKKYIKPNYRFSAEDQS